MAGLLSVTVGGFVTLSPRPLTSRTQRAKGGAVSKGTITDSQTFGTMVTQWSRSCSAIDSRSAWDRSPTSIISKPGSSQATAFMFRIWFTQK